MATTTLVGQNIGAEQRERARRTAATGSWMAFGTLSIAGLWAAVWAEAIIAAFVPGETEVTTSARSESDAPGKPRMRPSTNGLWRSP